jgi:hypothetical protein
MRSSLNIFIAQVGHLLVSMWKDLRHEQRAVYEAMAAAEKTRHEQENEAFEQASLEEDDTIQFDEELLAIDWPPGRQIDPQSLSTPTPPTKPDISSDVISNPRVSVPAVSDEQDSTSQVLPSESRSEPKQEEEGQLSCQLCILV